MKKIAFFDTKPYDHTFFEKYGKDYEIKYFDNKLNADTAALAAGFDGVIAFVNDDLSAKTIEKLYEGGVRVAALRCAGYNNVDFRAAYEKITVVRVPAYSPYAVAEHAIALLLTLNRKVHKAYNRTRDFDFRLSGLVGFDLFGKTIGVIGTGKIGRCFVSICKGFSMKVLAYDPYPAKDSDIDYTDLDTLLAESDIISLHCPLTESTRHMINEDTIAKMKDGAYIINTSRGQLIDSEQLLSALKNGKIGGAGLDVYEEEGEFFFEDFSQTIVKDDILSLLVSLPNVIITSHQAFLTGEALENIAKTTINNLDEFFSDGKLTNEICYQCKTGDIGANCEKRKKGERCF
ncbi:MAG: hydroxyacid dehydrogenase [Clostridiales bacterium GWF2_36_10]|nr:MAG: hydroxyacid dehydrogenase [Clostridiales bacterium GWF2_36_10]HAN21545.1 hydroxyacid dehydrogenase [Clostridiales bacterium]